MKTPSPELITRKSPNPKPLEMIFLFQALRGGNKEHSRPVCILPLTQHKLLIVLGI